MKNYIVATKNWYDLVKHESPTQTVYLIFQMSQGKRLQASLSSTIDTGATVYTRHLVHKTCP